MIKVQANRFEIRSNSLFLKIGIGAMVMECVGLYFFIPVLWEFDGSPMDIGAAAFMCLWFCVVLCGSLISFYRYSKKMIIDEDGVLYSAWFVKKQLKWSEIQDYGWSYDGRMRDGAFYSNGYILYFADEKQKKKNQKKQRLSQNALKVHLDGEEIDRFSDCVLPFCMRKTDVEPFISNL